MKYFAMLDTEEVVLIGEYGDINDAMNDEPANTHWVFSEQSLIDLRDNINEVLK